MVRTQIQLTEDQAARLRELAAREGLSLAELIRRSVDQYLGAARAPLPDERRQRAMEVAGRFASGTADTSERHDEVLAESYR